MEEKRERVKRARKISRWLCIGAILTVWAVVLLDINVWRHLTGAAATVDWGMAIFITIALAYAVAR